MTLNPETLRSLRMEIADSICKAQEHSPRTRLQQMRYSLLCNALLSLDGDSGLEPSYAIRIAVHALIEWRQSAPQPTSSHAAR